MNVLRPRALRGHPSLTSVAVVALCLLGDRAGACPTTDDFQDGTTQGWSEGLPSPNPPTNIPDGGPGGAGDRYLENVSSGGIGAGGRMVMFNQAQWADDYVSCGVNTILCQMANLGTTDLHMRVGLAGTNGTIFSSTDAVVLPPDGAWRPVNFGLSEAEMTRVGGTSSMSEVRASVATLRILSAEAGPSFIGDAIAGVLGVDNITAASSTAISTGSTPRFAVRLLPNEPNPFNPSTIIRYELRTPAPVRLAIFDVSGKAVRILVDERQQAGRYEVRWDGRRVDGVSLPSGVYFYRIEAGTFAEARRAVLAR